MVLDEKQKEIVESDKNKIIVVAGSGSGKTRVLTERVSYLLEKGVNPKDIVAITFTNQSAEEMRERLGEKGKDCFIGTIHAYANKLLLTNGFDTSKYIKNEDFDNFFLEIKRHPEVIAPVKYLLIDEFQDIDFQQDSFFKMINPENFFAVGDDWQNIYEWKGSDVSFFLDLVNDKDFTVYELGTNYRSGYRIVKFGMEFLRPIKNKLKKKVSCQNPNVGQVIELSGKDLPFIIEEIKKGQNYSDWFILTRTNNEISEIMVKLMNAGIPYDTFKKSDMSNSELKKRLKENTVKVLTAHSAKGLENENVVVIGIRPNNEGERRLAYVAATRAKSKLIWVYSKDPKMRKFTNFNDVSNWEN